MTFAFINTHEETAHVRVSVFECEPVRVGVRECLRAFACSSHRYRRRLRRFRDLRSTAGAAAVYVSVYVACTCASVYVYARPPIV